MELKIDGQRCDLGATACVVPGYDADKTVDTESCREGRSLKITLPPTPQNDALAAFARDPHAAVHFNEVLHRAELTADGAVLLSGTARLLATSDAGYTLEIRDGGARWASVAAQQMFNALDIDYTAPLTPTTIFESWTNTSPVKFFPIHRDEYGQQNSSLDLLPAERMLSVDDYHPFLHIATLLGEIFRQAGYRTQSKFLESDFFRSLYLSGAYPSRDTTAAANRMGFFARRLSPVTALADDVGRVYADPKAQYNTVGNLVETATPQTLDCDSEPIPELHNNGHCFALENGKIRFRPLTEVSVGFEYYLHYTTDHRIMSRTRLRGFDTLYLGPGAEMSFTLANRYTDHRAAITTNFSYRALVFNHTVGAQYRLTYTRNGAAGALWAEFAARSAVVTTPVSGSVSAPVLLVRSGNSWLPYTSDWALYNSYVGETGETTVDLRVRTAAEIVSPASPKHFDLIYLSGAEAGMSLTLHKACSLTPRFLSSPGFGSMLSFADVAQHRIRQAALINAVGHLFNLRFYTEEATKTVWIEPADDFFGAGREVDWTQKTDFSQPVERRDRVLDVHELRTWGYLKGDGAVTRFDAKAATPLGDWSVKSLSYAAKLGREEVRNPLFCPTLNDQGHYLNAPSAQIMQVGDRDDAEQDGTNFTPRIVRFWGMHPLPIGERWGYPSEQAAYPLAAFHFAGDSHAAGFTLGFEDRDGLRGLHRFYDRQVAQESSRERITLWLRIAPHEFEALFAPGCDAPDLRTTFRIDTGQGVVRATLQSIATYDPQAPSVRCTFNRLTED
ncbi:MAG: hypothetical protein RR199_01045 [Alistipes sp.]